MELLEGVVREDGGPGLVSDLEHEGVSSANGTRGGCHQFAVNDAGVEGVLLVGADAVTEGGIYHHGELEVFAILGEEGPHRLV